MNQRKILKRILLFWANDVNANAIVDAVLLAMTRQINTCAVAHFD